MRVERKESYALPVFDVRSDAPLYETVETAPDAADRVDVVLWKHQSSRDELGVTLYNDDERVDRYRFQITDSDVRWCACLGEDEVTDLPIDVRYAVHAFGYALTDSALGQPTTRWVNSLMFLACVADVREEYSDSPLIQQSARGISSFGEALSGIYLLQAVTSTADCVDVLAGINDSIDESEEEVPIERVEHAIWQYARENDLCSEYGLTTDAHGRSPSAFYTPLPASYFDDHQDDSTNGTSVVTGLYLGHQITEVDGEAGSYLAVNVATAFGIERFLFQHVGDGTYVFAESASSDRVSVPAVRAVERAGYTVDEASAAVVANDTVGQLEWALSWCTPLMGDVLGGLDPKAVSEDRWNAADAVATTLINQVLESTGALLLSVYMYEAKPDKFDAVARQVTQNITGHDPDELPPGAAHRVPMILYALASDEVKEEVTARLEAAGLDSVTDDRVSEVAHITKQIPLSGW